MLLVGGSFDETLVRMAIRYSISQEHNQGKHFTFPTPCPQKMLRQFELYLPASTQQRFTHRLASSILIVSFSVVLVSWLDGSIDLTYNAIAIPLLLVPGSSLGPLLQDLSTRYNNNTVALNSIRVMFTYSSTVFSRSKSLRRRPRLSNSSRDKVTAQRGFMRNDFR
jgi:hypothetical protein